MHDAFTGDRLWPPGHHEVNILIRPDLARNEKTGKGNDFADLVDGVRAVATQYPGTMVPVPDKWLHITVQALNHLPSDKPPINKETQARLIARLTELLGGWPAFTLQVGSPLAGASGVMLDTHPDESIKPLVTSVRDVFADVCGSESIGHDSQPAHMALVYAHNVPTKDCDQIHATLARRLRRDVRPSHVQLPIRDIVLAEVRQDPDACAYPFTVLHPFQLAATGVADEPVRNSSPTATPSEPTKDVPRSTAAGLPSARPISTTR